MVQCSVSDMLGPLNDIEERYAPESLYAVGDVSILRGHPRVAIVGSRKAQREKLEMARGLARELVRRGVVIVSGLAQGVDTVAHTAAIEAGGRTIAVLGNALDHFFPPQNRELQRRIMASHLAISQFPPGTPPRRGNFPQRNRTMALISNASIIVEAAEVSGTKHQGWEAIRLGRPLFILEHLVEVDFDWPREMLGYGAIPLRHDDVESVLDEVPLPLTSDFNSDI